MDDKRNQIIAAALQRFSHFGIAKTTMSEIAEDLNLSKANLYYYFPDKFSLIEAIVYGFMEESEAVIGQALGGIPNTLDRLIYLLDLKREYLNKYYMLVLDLYEMNISEERWQTLSNALYKREVENISNIFQKGVDRGELVTMDVTFTSELYVSVIRGLAMFCNDVIPHPVVNKEEIAAIVERQKQVAAIFINGIKKVSSDN